MAFFSRLIVFSLLAVSLFLFLFSPIVHFYLRVFLTVPLPKLFQSIHDLQSLQQFLDPVAFINSPLSPNSFATSSDSKARSFGSGSLSYHTIDNIWNEDELKSLRSLIATVGEFETVVRDQTSRIESIGEETYENPRSGSAAPKCQHPYLVLNGDETKCIFPTRLDVGLHYVSSGGPSGVKERIDRLTPRTLGFSQFFISGVQVDNATDIPEFQSLFRSKHYLAITEQVCGAKNAYLDPFQMSIIMQLPGQQLATHLDVPWLKRANRREFPQWLLVVMANSGKFEAVPQVQGVAYLNQAKYQGGEFLFYPEFKSFSQPSPWIAKLPEALAAFLAPVDRLYRLAQYSSTFLAYPPIRNSAIMLDGSIVPHGTALFQPEVIGTERDLPLDRMGKTDGAKLKIVRLDSNPDDIEVRLVNRNGEILRRYTLEEVRISLVWRSLCFENEHRRDEYHRESEQNPLKLEEVFDTLFQDLETRGRWKKGQKRPEGFQLAEFLLKEYSIMNVIYPAAPVVFPFNWCALDRVQGWEGVGKTIRNWFC